MASRTLPRFKQVVLNDVFTQALEQARQKPVQLSHNQQVARLYRKSLKTMMSWAIHRETINEEAMKIRQRFEDARGCNPAKAAHLLRAGHEELLEFTHPDPYCLPPMPGGSKHMRYSPLPNSICFPDGDVPADAPDYYINPDWSVAKPETGKAAIGSVVVDFGKKNME